MQSILKSNRRTDISFDSSGQINISARLARKLGLQTGDAIDIKTDGFEYYIYIRTPSNNGVRYEAQCFPSNKRGKHFRAYSRRLCLHMLRACGATDKVRLATGETIIIQGCKYINIITKLILYK